MLIRSTVQPLAVSRRRRPRGFTLLELMIVVGIVAILLAFIFPMVRRSVESSRRISCMAKVRTLTSAILAYSVVNDNVLPDACAVNYFESQLAPITQGQAAGTRVGAFYVLPTIGALLQPYLPAGPDVWTCPSAAEQPKVFSGTDPLSGFGFEDPPIWFRPQYDYLCAKEYIQFAAAARPNGDQTKLRTWASRNVSGLKMNKVAPLGNNSAVVLIHDRDSSYHANAKSPIYTSPRDGDYFQNFGYLDGHVEGRRYRNVNEYMACLHGPIRQSWYGMNFETVLPEIYAGY